MYFFMVFVDPIRIFVRMLLLWVVKMMKLKVNQILFIPASAQILRRYYLVFTVSIGKWNRIRQFIQQFLFFLLLKIMSVFLTILLNQKQVLISLRIQTHPDIFHLRFMIFIIPLSYTLNIIQLTWIMSIMRLWLHLLKLRLKNIVS